MTTSERLHLAALAFLELGNAIAAAKAVNVSERTFRRWQARPEFARELAALATAASGDGIEALRRSISGAVDLLAEIAKDTKQPGAVRVNAAGKLVELGLRSVEVLEIKARLSRLEDASPTTKSWR